MKLESGNWKLEVGDWNVTIRTGGYPEERAITTLWMLLIDIFTTIFAHWHRTRYKRNKNVEKETKPTGFYCPQCIYKPGFQPVFRKS